MSSIYEPAHRARTAERRFAAARRGEQDKHRRYNRSAKGRARNHRYNRTVKRLKAQAERNQVRRERMARHKLLTLAHGGTR